MKRTSVALGLVLAYFLAIVPVFACDVVVIPEKVGRNLTVSVKYVENPAAFIDVVILNWSGDSPHVVSRTRTDGKGEALFHDLTPGQYEITSSAWPPFAFSHIIVVENRPGTSPLSIIASREPEPPLPVRLVQIAGVMYDPSGAPIPGAVVTIERTDHSRTTVAAMTTDHSGRVNLSVGPGIYNLKVSRQGFVTALIPVQVASGADAWASFRLTMTIGSCPAASRPAYTIAAEPKALTNDERP